MSDAPGFLSRWSRRKQALARGEAVVEPPPPEAPVVESPPVEPPEAALAEAPAAEPPFDPASLPDLETLDAASDFAAFLKPGVPAALRNAALRKAWLLDPLIRDHQSPLDYAWDFNSPGGLPHGFAAELGEAAEVVREMLARAVGLTASEPEEPAAPPALAVAPAPAVAETPPAAEALAPPAAAVAEAPAPEAPSALPVRRHGGAVPT